MSNITNPLDILKRLDLKQNVTIRVIDEPTGKVVQEHIGHNSATNSLLTGIAHYLMGDGVLNQGQDTLSMWVPQYISLGTMGLTSQESETLVEGDLEYIVPSALGYTPVAPDDATPWEKELNARLRFSEYLNQTPGFGADGYDDNSNNDREWFGLGYPYSLKPDALKQNFYTWDGTEATFTLSETPLSVISVTLFTDGIVDQDTSNTSVPRETISTKKYSVSGNYIHLDPYSEESVESPIPPNSRIAVIYAYNNTDASNCELIKAKLDNSGNIVPLTLRSKITYRDMVPEFQSEVPNTLDVVFSAMISTGALADFRNGRDYVYITEAGLWSTPAYTDSGDNGMLAGYRIMPSDDEVNILGAEKIFQSTGVSSYSFTEIFVSIDSITCDGALIPKSAYTFEIVGNHTVLTFDEDHIPAAATTIIVVFRAGDAADTWKDMKEKANRELVQKSILRIGVNQVAQIVWKIQLGGLAQLNGLRYLYPSQFPEEVWEVIK